MTFNTKSGRIADPVHGYIHFTSIERVLLKHRLTQRLRYIAQNGLAHLVYPELRTSRFSHSLGAMHLASSFLSSSLRNAEPMLRSRLLVALCENVEEIAGKMGGIEQAANLLEGEPLTAQSFGDQRTQAVMRLVEQALRLAALFHDLGHLPFSHDFENALDELWRDLPEEKRQQSPFHPLLKQQIGGAKLHERLGHGLSSLLMQNLFLSEIYTDRLHGTAKICFTLAQNILDAEEVPSPNSKEAAVHWLHQLMDGEIDVDRCDYILRDGRNYDFEFAAFDLNRLLDNLTVVEQTGAFNVALSPHGLAAAETFLISRFRSYQYGVRHHKVAQVGAALQHSIARILSGHSPALEQFNKDLVDVIKSDTMTDDKARTQLLERFAGYDDVWWMSIMRAIPDAQRDEWLELVCWRQAGPRTLWKWRGDFHPAEGIKEWNILLPQTGENIKQIRWDQAVSGLKDDKVLVVRHWFNPWKENAPGVSQLSVQMNDGSLQPVSELSPIVLSLQQAWNDDVQVQAFAQSGASITGEDVLARLTTSLETGE